MQKNSERNGLEIAIIGMSGRFPGANNLHQFWENLKNSVNSIRFFTEEELLENPNIDPDEVKKSNYVKAMGVLTDVEYFDAFFFGYSPLEAETLDPQIRIFYEICWEALEDAGCDPSTYNRSIGIYAGGAANHTWELLTIISGKGDFLGIFTSGTLSDKDYLPSRIAHKLNLKGPAISMHTACSTSLVAVDLACRGLLTGQCDAALAGGVSVMPENAKSGGYLYEDGLIYSRDGYVRAFDAKAKGVVFSQGGGVVLLKRLDDAVADGDSIYAVIKGFAANNDGIAKSSFSAPTVDGQAQCIRAALYMAEINSDSITYVETHGTGTELGDPIEIEALKLAFVPPEGVPAYKKHSCAIGSVKTNIGHLDTGAGVAGIIKVALMMKHRLIPSSLNFETPNPKIDFENSPFFVNTRLREWKSSEYPLRAGISSFGVGGTNAHVIMEEPPEREPSSTSRAYQLIFLSARTANALEQTTKNFLNYLKEHPDINLADVAYTLKAGRKSFEHKRMLVCSEMKEALDILESKDNESSSSDTNQDHHRLQTHYEKEAKRAVFMFPGQGSQYVNMAWGLYESEPVFRQEMDRCFEILRPLMGYDIKDILYPFYRSNRSNRSYKSYKSQINQTEIAQPVIFAIEYALAKLLMAWGIMPYAMIGHSIGEFVAACLSGVFSLEDVLVLVAWRGKLMQQMPEGSMLSIPLSEKELKSLLILMNHEELDLAAVNGPSQLVVSGPHEAIDAFAQQLKEKNHQYRKLHTSHAFHSKMMDPILKTFAEKVASVKVNEPFIPFISNVTGQWITFQDIADSNYWVRHVRSTVRFADGIAELLKEKHSLFIEVGPGRTLNTFVRQHPDKQPGHRLVNLVRHPNEEAADDYYLLNKIGQIWLYGMSINWKGFYSGERRQRLRLPTYPFQRNPYWIEGNPIKMAKEGIQGLFTPGKKTDIADWFYVPSWKPSVISSNRKPEPADDVPHKWLVFKNDHDGDFASQLVNRLKETADENNVTVVKIGKRFAKQGDVSYIIEPGQENDYETLIKTLHDSGRIPDRIVHLWNLTGGDNDSSNDNRDLSWKRVERALDHGFYSLLYLAKAIGAREVSRETHITVLTNGMQEVRDQEVVWPEKAVVLGPLMTIPLEYPEIKCRCIDINEGLPGPGTGDSKNREQWLMNQLLKEFQPGINLMDNTAAVIAYRGNYRFVRTYEPVPLHQAESRTPRLRDRGVYLITGGLGGIGLVLARHLARVVKAKLILTGRSAFPGRQEWEEWLNTHPSPDPISQKIRKVKELESLGAEVQVYSVDVTDEPGMRNIIEQVQNQWGTINGVIHSAGVPGGGVIRLKTREMADRVLAPKVKGTWALNRALRGIHPDFILLCSSVNSVLPSIGQVDYFAGNAFLDAFAFYKNSRDTNHTFTVSINWDAWQEVGMAVEAAKQSAGDRQRQSLEPQPVNHPLFDHYTIEYKRGSEAQEVYTFTTYFSIHRHWVLSEHQSRERNGIIPGVTYLEMALAALRNRTGNQEGIVVIREVSFSTALIMKEGEEREVRLTLKPEGETHKFSVESRIKPGENKWENHARGEVAVVPGPGQESLKHNLNAIEMRCNLEEIDAASGWGTEGADLENSLLIFGPRWKNLKTIKNGKNEGLALLELPDEFMAELDQYTLHPALLDVATSFFSGSVTDKPYIPFSYKKVRVNRGFPKKIYAHGRWLDDGDGSAHKDFLEFDVTIMDEQGLELVDIEGFKLLEISGEILERLKAREQGELPAQVSLGPEEELPEPKSGYDELVKDGILPEEGVDAFNRILGENLPQVVVSVHDLQALIKANQTADSYNLETLLQDRGTADTLHSRPDISTQYIAPSTDMEQELAKIWQELLGIRQVGVKDDFFELGGDSLKAMAVVSEIHKKLHVEVPISAFFSKPAIRNLAGYIRSTYTVEFFSIRPIEKKEYYALSSAQKRLYVLQQMDPDSIAYHLPYRFELTGKLNMEDLEEAFVKLIKRHESLRTSFEILNEEPVQLIHDDPEFEIEYYDMEVTGAGDRCRWEDEGVELAASAIENFVRTFDLSRAPLMRVGLIKLPHTPTAHRGLPSQEGNEPKHILMVDMHHIISDETSYMILMKEILAFYGGGKLPQIKVQYKDFSAWQNNLIQSGAIKSQEEYWLKIFDEEIPLLKMPTDHERSDVLGFEGCNYKFEMDSQLYTKILDLVLESKTTLNIFLLAAYNVLLFKCTGQETLLVGNVIAGRRHVDLQPIIGFFVNMLALKNHLEEDQTFAEFLKEVKRTSVEAYENQDYQFEELVNRLNIPREPGRHPLIDTVFVLRSLDDLPSDITRLALERGSLKINSNEIESKVSHFDFMFHTTEENNSIIMRIEYSSSLFKPTTIEELAKGYLGVLEQVVKNKKIKLRDIALKDDYITARADKILDQDLGFEF